MDPMGLIQSVTDHVHPAVLLPSIFASNPRNFTGLFLTNVPWQRKFAEKWGDFSNA